MKKTSSIKIVSLLFVIIFGLPWIQSIVPSAVRAAEFSQDGPEVDPELLELFDQKDSVDYFIYFDAKADLSPAHGMSWEERGRFVYERLTEVANTSQKSVRGVLDAQGVSYETFWISNVIAVKSSSRATFDQVRTFPEVKMLTTIPKVQLVEPVTKKEESTPPGIKAVETNLTHINADDVWAFGYHGTDMVVGSIDTGVYNTHETLVKQYRGNKGSGIYEHAYNWWDAVNGQNSAYDDNNHGTHTVGIMVGDDGAWNQIGVAPEAKWIACKALSGQGYGSGADLLKCGEFMAAPTDLSGRNANPDLRPNVVNNSWGDCGRIYYDWYEDTIDSWLAAGIYPLFANGNAGGCGYPYPPGRNTVGNPARSYHVTGVGATGHSNGEYATFSNWGPTDSLDTLNPMGHADMKPQVVSPGTNIRSAVAVSDTTFAYYSGTSMSTPHVAGLIALMWEAASCLVGDYVNTETILQQSAGPIYYDDSGNGTATYPNYATGWGEIDAEAAVLQARDYCGDANLVGHVYDASTAEPIAGALVEAVAQGDLTNDRFNKTDSDGAYNISVNGGKTFDITVTNYGYEPQTKTTFVSPGESVQTNFNLVGESEVDLSGTVYSGHGYPLVAALIFETPYYSEAIFNDPFSGNYNITVYEDTNYDITVVSVIPGYQKLVDSGVVFIGPSENRNFIMQRTADCVAPGYEVITGLYESFRQEIQPEGWTVVDEAGTGATWRFDDPDTRTNLTGGTGPFAIVDSDYAGYVEVDTSLISPSVDMSGEATVTLSFDQDFNYWGGGKAEIADVDVSINGGPWQNVLRQTSEVRGPNHQVIDISTYAAGQPDVRVRFHFYNAEFEWWWQVDNVDIAPFKCDPIAGGVMAGFVHAKNTGSPLSDARIASNTAFTYSKDTFLDSGWGNGFYWLFQAMTSDPQTISFEVSRPAYIVLNEDVSLSQDDLTRKDFILDSFTLFLPVFRK